MALRIGCLGPLSEAAELIVDCLGLALDGPLLVFVVDDFGRLRPSGARLTINLELVRTRGI